MARDARACVNSCEQYHWSKPILHQKASLFSPLEISFQQREIVSIDINAQHHLNITQLQLLLTKYYFCANHTTNSAANAA
jgi:hypothetical protein